MQQNNSWPPTALTPLFPQIAHNQNPPSTFDFNIGIYFHLSVRKISVSVTELKFERCSVLPNPPIGGGALFWLRRILTVWCDVTLDWSHYDIGDFTSRNSAWNRWLRHFTEIWVRSMAGSQGSGQRHLIVISCKNFHVCLLVFLMLCFANYRGSALSADAIGCCKPCYREQLKVVVAEEDHVGHGRIILRNAQASHYRRCCTSQTTKGEGLTVICRGVCRTTQWCMGGTGISYLVSCWSNS